MVASSCSSRLQGGIATFVQRAGAHGAVRAAVIAACNIGGGVCSSSCRSRIVLSGLFVWGLWFPGSTGVLAVSKVVVEVVRGSRPCLRTWVLCASS